MLNRGRVLRRGVVVAAARGGRGEAGFSGVFGRASAFRRYNTDIAEGRGTVRGKPAPVLREGGAKAMEMNIIRTTVAERWRRVFPGLRA